MTKPIQEPIFPRQLRQLKYGNDQLFRRPSPVTGTQHAWMAMDNWLTGTDTDGSGIEVDWNRLWISDNGFDYFDYEVIAGGGAGGVDKIVAKLLEPGIYTYTYQLYTDGLAFATPTRMYFNATCKVNTDIGFIDAAFPGSHLVQGPLRITRQYDMEDANPDLDIQGSWTIPVFAGVSSPPGSPTGKVEFSYTPDGDAFDENWVVNCWIVRHDSYYWTEGTGEPVFPPTIQV